VESDSKKPRWGFLIDLRRCIGCHSCTVACKAENEVPLGVFRCWVKTVEVGRYPRVRRMFLPQLCNNCENPPCVAVCPVEATWKREDGIVVVDPHKCIGCRYCMASCPYGVRYLHPTMNIVEKCHWCVHRVERGLRPACVEACPAGARIFGDLNDPDSGISRMLSLNPIQGLKPDLGTGPQTFYIGMDNRLVEEEETS